MADGEEPENEPDIEALRLQYDELREAIDRQYNSMEKEGEHSRRMFRILLVFIGILVTGLSTMGGGRVQELIFANDACGMYAGTNCIVSLENILVVGIIFLIISAFLYLRDSSGGLKMRTVKSDEAFDEEHQLRFESERRYLDDRTEIMTTLINERHESHSGFKSSEAVASFGLFVSIVSFTLVSYVISTNSAVSITSFTIVMAVTLGLISWSDNASNEGERPEDKLKSITASAFKDIRTRCANLFSKLND